MWNVVFAEKGSDSTTEKAPIQHNYRPRESWDAYARNLQPILASSRPHLNRSYAGYLFNRTFSGFAWIDRDFQARRHWRERPHLAYRQLKRMLKRTAGSDSTCTLR